MYPLLERMISWISQQDGTDNAPYYLTLESIVENTMIRSLLNHLILLLSYAFLLHFKQI